MASFSLVKRALSEGVQPSRETSEDAHGLRFVAKDKDAKLAPFFQLKRFLLAPSSSWEGGRKHRNAEQDAEPVRVGLLQQQHAQRHAPDLPEDQQRQRCQHLSR